MKYISYISMVLVATALLSSCATIPKNAQAVENFEMDSTSQLIWVQHDKKPLLDGK